MTDPQSNDPFSLEDFFGVAEAPKDSSVSPPAAGAAGSTRVLGLLVALALAFLLGAGLYQLLWRTGDRNEQMANPTPLAVVRMPILPREPDPVEENSVRQALAAPAEEERATIKEPPVETVAVPVQSPPPAETASADPASPPVSTPATTEAMMPKGAYTLQVGAYLYPENLRRVEQALAGLPWPTHILQKQTEVRMHRVCTAAVPAGEGDAAVRQLRADYPLAFALQEGGRDRVCLGTVVTPTAARALAARAPDPARATVETVLQEQTLQVLRIGDFATRAEAEAALDRVARQGYRAMVVLREQER